METSVQLFAALYGFIISISHIVQPRAWAEFFIMLREKGQKGVFVVAFLHLPFGVFIVTFHNVWEGIPTVLTVIGWSQVLKGLLYFVFPEVGLRGLSFVSVEKANRFRIAGVFLAAWSGLLAYAALRSP